MAYKSDNLSPGSYRSVDALIFCGETGERVTGPVLVRYLIDNRRYSLPRALSRVGRTLVGQCVTCSFSDGDVWKWERIA